MQKREFERLVQEAWRQIPARFRDQVENLAIVVEDEPSPSTLRHSGVPPGDDLLGLYQGIPLTQRPWGYGWTLPDKISLYQGPIERAARDESDVARVVYETLWHELAHYFGMSERQVRASERRRRRSARMSTERRP